MMLSRSCGRKLSGYSTDDTEMCVYMCVKDGKVSLFLEKERNR